MTRCKEKFRILICENELDLSGELETRLIGLGHTVCDTGTTTEGLLELTKQHQPDLVLLDIAAKGQIDGIDAARMIKNKWGIPILFMSSQADADRLKTAGGIFPFTYILKPSDDRSLEVAIEMAMFSFKMEIKRRPPSQGTRFS